MALEYFRGLGVCSIGAYIVNSVQVRANSILLKKWFGYEQAMGVARLKFDPPARLNHHKRGWPNQDIAIGSTVFGV